MAYRSIYCVVYLDATRFGQESMISSIILSYHLLQIIDAIVILGLCTSGLWSLSVAPDFISEEAISDCSECADCTQGNCELRPMGEVYKYSPSHDVASFPGLPICFPTSRSRK